MKTQKLYRELELPAYGLTLRFVRDDSDRTRYVGFTTDEELDKFEKQIEERHGIHVQKT